MEKEEKNLFQQTLHPSPLAIGLAISSPRLALFPERRWPAISCSRALSPTSSAKSSSRAAKSSAAPAPNRKSPLAQSIYWPQSSLLAPSSLPLGAAIAPSRRRSPLPPPCSGRRPGGVVPPRPGPVAPARRSRPPSGRHRGGPLVSLRHRRPRQLRMSPSLSSLRPCLNSRQEDLEAHR